MKIVLGSDLHLEFDNQLELPPVPDCDVVVLAGDIHYYELAIMWIRENFPDSYVPVIYVPGNHDAYHGDMGTILSDNRDFGHIKVLKGGKIFDYNGVRFVGGTLWSGLNLPGYRTYRDDEWARAISDFQITSYNGARWTPGHHATRHILEHARIQEAVRYAGPDKTVVVTHFVPTAECIDPFFKNSPLNPYFVGDCDDILNKEKPDLWLFGHTHAKCDKLHSNGKTRLVCNPRGYPSETKKKKFVWKEIEL